MRLKLDVATIFPIFARGVEKQLNHSFSMLYTNGGGEFNALKSSLDSLGITHKITPPHTPEHNDVSERRRRHIFETTHTLLHHASIPIKFWHICFSYCNIFNQSPTLFSIK